MDLTPSQIPQIPATAQTLEDVVTLVDSNPRLLAVVRRDIVSDLRAAARLLGRHASEIAADPPSLREEFRKVAPGVAGISAKRFTNIRSSVARAFRLAKVLPRKRPRCELTPAWRSLWDQIQERHIKARLSRFVEFCGQLCIERSEVDDLTLELFREYLEATSLYQDPKKVADDAARALNRVAKEQSLPLKGLRVSKRGRYTTRPLDTYPVSFREDLANYEKVLIRSDYFAEKGPSKPLRPSSVNKIKSDVRQVLNAAVETGHPVEAFKSLADLVQEPVIEAAFGWLTDRNAGTHPVGLRDIAANLFSIAKHHVGLPEDRLRRLKIMRGKVSTYNDGMSEKNRRRLLQFDDWKNTNKLVCLPDLLLARANQRPESLQSATNALYATAITLLLACPMRMKNLAALDLDRHVLPFGRGASLRYRISVPGGEVKNNVPIDTELQQDASKVLTQFLRQYRHLLVGEPTSALFPSGKGGARGSHSLGYGISNIIRNETGLDVHPHLFRHLAAKMYLEVFHGDYETVRRQLGHKKYDTTLKFYAPFDNKSGPVAYLCRPKCSFRPLSVRRRPGFSSPVLSAAAADCRSH